MSIQDQEHSVPYIPPDAETVQLLDSINALLKGERTTSSEISTENRFSISTKEVLARFGYIFLPVGGESIEDMITKGVPIDILTTHRMLSPRSWKKVLPPREVAIKGEGKYPFFPCNNYSTHAQLVEEVKQYGKDVFPQDIYAEVIPCLGLPVTVIQALVGFEKRYGCPLGRNLRVSTEVTYPGNGSNFVLDIEYIDQGQGKEKKYLSSGRAVTEVAERKGLIILEKRSVWESFAAA